METPSKTRKGSSAFSLRDASALIVGYALASLLVRAYWPEGSSPSIWAFAMIAIVYCWLGLAMSGPIVLIRRGPARTELGSPIEIQSDNRTWAELAWMIIGFYWIGLTLLVVPTRIQNARFLDSAFLGIFPILAALLVWRIGPKRSWTAPNPRPGESSWTHQAGVGLLLAWPIAWLGLIALGRTIF